MNNRNDNSKYDIHPKSFKEIARDNFYDSVGGNQVKNVTPKQNFSAVGIALLVIAFMIISMGFM